MNASYKLIIRSSILDMWFTWSGNQSSGWGTYARLDVAKILQTYPYLQPKSLHMSDAVFIISKRYPQKKTGNTTNYCAIIDAAFIDSIHTSRWVSKGTSQYMAADGGTKKLHKVIYTLSGKTPTLGRRIIVHHNNFSAFDNRIVNLDGVTRSQHAQRTRQYKAKQQILDVNIISNNIDFLDFLNTYF